MQQKLVIITGPTAAGKSDLAVNIAPHIKGVVINADAMQVYKEIPIVSAAPIQLHDIEHCLYGYIKGDQVFSVANWLADLRQVLDRCIAQGKTPIITGGTTMYVRLLIDGLSAIPDIDPVIQQESKMLLHNQGNAAFHELLLDIDQEAGNKILPSDPQRMLRAYGIKKTTGQSISYFHRTRTSILRSEEKIIKLAFMPPRDFIYNNCHSRFVAMIKNGALEEIKTLMEKAYPNENTIYKAIGVREIQSYLEGLNSLDAMIDLAVKNTRNYAKRQMTWIRNKFQDFITLNDHTPNTQDIVNLIRNKA